MTEISGRPQVSHSIAADYGGGERALFAPSRPATPASDRAIFVDCIGAEQAQSHIAEWRDLMARALEPNVFLDPAFALAAARRVAPRVQFLLVWEREEAAPRRLIALWPVAPLNYWRGSTVRGWLHDYSCSGAPLLDRDRAATALSALLERLRYVNSSACALLASHIRRDGPTFVCLRQFAQRRGLSLDFLYEYDRAALFLHDHGGEAAPMASRKKQKEWRRQRRRLGDRGPISFGLACEGAELNRQIEAFLRIEASGWKGGHGDAFLTRPGHAAFLREMAAAAAQRGKIRIYWMACGERIVASNILLVAAGEAFFWKTAFDEDFAFASPAVLLTIHMTEALGREPGLRFVDSCAAADHPMIGHIWRDRAPMADVMLALDSGKSGRFRRALWFERQRRNLREFAKSVWIRLGFG